MLTHEIVSNEVADAFIKSSRALQIGEKERQAGDFQPLIDVERIGSIDVAESLIAEEPLGGQERPPVSEQMMESSPPTRPRGARVG